MAATMVKNDTESFEFSVKNEKTI